MPLLEQVTAADVSPSADTLPAYRALSHALPARRWARARTCSRAIATRSSTARRSTRARDRPHAGTGGVDGGAAGRRRRGPVVDRFTDEFPLRRLASGHGADRRRPRRWPRHDVVARPSDGAAALRRAVDVIRAHCEPPFRAVPQRGPRRPRPRAGGAGGEDHHGRARVLGGARYAGGAAVERAGHRRHRAPGPAGHARRLRGGQCPDGDVSVATTRALWIVIPLVVFLAVYTPGAVNFVVGQASFTVFVVVLFNLLGPGRLADRSGARARTSPSARGSASSVGALLWPRGACGVARRDVRRPVARRRASTSRRRAPGDPRRGVDRRRPQRGRRGCRRRAPGRWPRWRISPSSTAVVTSTVRPWGGLLVDAHAARDRGRRDREVGGPARRGELSGGPGRARRRGRRRRHRGRWRGGCGRGSRASRRVPAGPASRSTSRRRWATAWPRRHARASRAAIGLVWVHEWLGAGGRRGSRAPDAERRLQVLAGGDALDLAAALVASSPSARSVRTKTMRSPFLPEIFAQSSGLVVFGRSSCSRNSCLIESSRSCGADARARRRRSCA